MPSISASARSAVDSVSTSGVLPDRDAARGGRLDVDVVHADRVVRDRAQLRRGVDQLGVDRVGEQRQQALQLGRARQQLGARRRQRARARPPRRARATRRSSASPGSCRVTNTRALGTHWVEEHGRNGGVREDAGATCTQTTDDGRSGGKRALGVERGGALRRAPARVRRRGRCASASTRPTRPRASGADRLVVAGGDGSIAPAAAAAGAAGIPLAVVPGGHGERLRRAARAARRRSRPPAGWRCTARSCGRWSSAG